MKKELLLRLVEKEKNLMSEEFLGYPTFDEVMDDKVRAYNRVVTARNINESHGSVLCKKYLEYFPKDERISITAMAMYIKQYGGVEVVRNITNGC